jgi:hypothetical protein
MFLSICVPVCPPLSLHGVCFWPVYLDQHSIILRRFVCIVFSMCLVHSGARREAAPEEGGGGGGTFGQSRCALLFTPIIDLG